MTTPAPPDPHASARELLSGLRRRWRGILALVALLALAAGTLSLNQRQSGSETQPFPTTGLTFVTSTASANDFKTDFSKSNVPFREIKLGCSGKDCIPALVNPKYVSVAEANSWLHDQEPVILVRVGDDVRAFPIQILLWHEIVNTTIGGAPIAVTYCPLCNTAIAFDRAVNEQTLTFRVTGRLRYSNLIMYDDVTNSWWQQATGGAIIGAYTGLKLVTRPAPIISWAAFKATWPAGAVLSRDTGYQRDYGRNPYPGYDDVNSSPYLYRGPELPNTLPAMRRVLGVTVGHESVAYAFDGLAKAHVVNDTISGTPVAIVWSPGTASPLDQDQVAQGQDVGFAQAFERLMNGKALTLQWDGARFTDRETKSTWNALGQATGGPLAGNTLKPVPATDSFWFAWVAFQPDTRVVEA